MFDKEALLSLQTAEGTLRANQALTMAGIHESVIAAPADVKLHDIERFLPAPRHYRVRFMASSMNAFINYCNSQTHSCSAAFVDKDNMRAVCVFDLGSPAEPLHGLHRASIDFQKTAEMKALHNLCEGALKGSLSQRELAEWMEEWRHNIVATRDGKKMEMHVAISAIRSVDVKAARKVGSVVGNFSESSSVFTERAVDSAVMPPDTILFTCCPFADTAERTFEVRISVLTSGDAVGFKLRILNRDLILERIGEEICSTLSSNLIGVGAVHMGTVAMKGSDYD